MLRKALMVAGPSRKGMTMSVMTKAMSPLCRAKSASASAPSLAVNTRYPCFWRMALVISWKARSSSTMSSCSPWPCGVEVIGMNEVSPAGEEAAGGKDAEPRALTQGALGADEAAMRLDDVAHRRQAEAGALADGFEGEERFPDPLEVLGRDPGAGVGHGEHDVGAGGRVGDARGRGLLEVNVLDLEQKRAAVRHGVARIHAQVHQDLMHLRGIGEDGPETLRHVGLDLDLA